MRPGSDVLGARSRKDLDPSVPTPTSLGHGAPTSFRMATEEDMRASSSTKATDPGSDSTFGVRSLQDPIYEASSPSRRENEEEVDDDDDDSHEGRRRATLKPKTRGRESSHESVPQAQANTGDSSPSHPSQEGIPPSMSHSLASLSLDSQAPLSSIPSSPKSTSNRSFRPSDEEMDDGGSQAIVSSEEDDDAEPRSDIQDSVPQLIMPSIKMPSRRPFTERGKGMGRLKMLIAGDSGVGKTSLIKSIVQTCEDIVHVDPLSPNLPSIDHLPSRKSKSKQVNHNSKSTQYITEVYASTKAYPSWWSDVEETKVLRRRKSLGDIVLERNLCFVDTPGYGHGMSRMENIELIMQYVEAQFMKTCYIPTASEGDIVGLLSGNGGAQVDVVFYMIAHDLKDEDIVFLRHLAALTNVIPLIAKVDTASPEETEVLRRSMTDKLLHAQIKSFAFDPDNSTTSPPLTVCSAPSDDDDNMDASILMSPDYVQPLIPSELAILVQQVFSPENISRLRHLAAKKLVLAQGSRVLTTPTTFPHSVSNPVSNYVSNYPSTSSTSTASSPTTSQTILSYTSGLSPYVQARIADHTQREERYAQIRLAKWANDLQRSLQNERARYEAIMRGERAVWLSQKLGECVNDGSLVPVKGGTLAAPIGERLAPGKSELLRVSGHRGLLDAGDPLGLLRWNETMKRKGWIAFQVVGGFGVLGAVAVWAARAMGVGTDGYYWDWNWGWLGGKTWV